MVSVVCDMPVPLKFQPELGRLSLMHTELWNAIGFFVSPRVTSLRLQPNLRAPKLAPTRCHHVPASLGVQLACEVGTPLVIVSTGPSKDGHRYRPAFRPFMKARMRGVAR